MHREREGAASRRRWLMPTADEAERLVKQHGSPLMLYSPQLAVDRCRMLAEALPRATVFYAVKSSPHPGFISALAAAGVGFDLASAGEIALLERVGATAARSIYTHPIKTGGDICRALDFGCEALVVDNPDELLKCAPHRARARLLIRLSFDNPDAVVDLGRKFGADPDRVPALMRSAIELGLDVCGLSFHIGSQNLNPQRYVEAMQTCRALFDRAAGLGLDFDTLDIGGGFPVVAGLDPIDFEGYVAPVAAALDRLFPDTRVWLEPGRFVSAPAMTLLSTVVGRARRGGVWWYYIDDGLYGSFSGKVFDKADCPMIALRTLRQPDLPRERVVIAGPTCDGFDVVHPGTWQPACRIGDLFVSPLMGAYSWASATGFNSLTGPTFVSIDP